MFYLIKSVYIGPNDKDNYGNFRLMDAIIEICTKPGQKNMSNEICTSGWLGSTNDHSEHALGEYETIEDARKEAFDRGYTEMMDKNDESDFLCEEIGLVESYITKRDSLEQCNAGDYFQYDKPTVTVDTDLNKLEDELQTEANENEGAYLHYLTEYLEFLQNEIKENQNVEE